MFEMKWNSLSSSIPSDCHALSISGRPSEEFKPREHWGKELSNVAVYYSSIVLIDSATQKGFVEPGMPGRWTAVDSRNGQ